MIYFRAMFNGIPLNPALLHLCATCPSHKKHHRTYSTDIHSKTASGQNLPKTDFATTSR
jgi:hypothetical protein